MVKEQKISEYRNRLNKTLTSHDLVNKDSIRNLVRNQLLETSPSDNHGYIDSFLEKRTTEVSNFLDTLRSVSKNDNEMLEMPKTDGVPQRDWKLKHDSEDFRVMYREGAEGTPFHTLLVEGYVDGPLDVCLCISFEEALFKKWWPQFSIPPFKITTADCLQKVGMGEQIVQLRVKVPWPVSAREVIVHYFEVDYFEDDLIIVLLNSISDTKSIDKSTHGFTKEGIPDAKDIVRMDVVGGFVLQKVASNISYFRTIATMDMKLDFIPPSLINFVSRQLVGSGFKLYKKTVASIAKGDEDFGKALQKPVYERVREGLASKSKLKKALQHEALEDDKTPSLGGLTTEIPQVDTMVIEPIVLSDSHATKPSNTDTLVAGQAYNGEIVEIELENAMKPAEEGQTSHGKIDTEEEQLSKLKEDILTDHSTINWSADQHDKEKRLISPEVEHALSVLDRAISLVRKGFSIQNLPGSKPNRQELPDSQKASTEVGSISSENTLDDRVSLKVPKVDDMEAVSDDESSSGFFDIRHDKHDSPPQEVNHNQSCPSPQPIVTTLNKTQEDVLYVPHSEAPVLDNKSNGFKEVVVKANAVHASSDTNGEFKRKKQRGCCIYFFYSDKR